MSHGAGWGDRKTDAERRETEKGKGEVKEKRQESTWRRDKGGKKEGESTGRRISTGIRRIGKREREGPGKEGEEKRRKRGQVSKGKNKRAIKLKENKRQK